MTKFVKDQFGSKKKAPVRVMELTIIDAFDLFCQENPKVKILKCTFENYRPKNTRLKHDARQFVCCCQYHVNIDYLRKLLNNSLAINKKAVKLKNSAKLIDAAICDSKNVSCIVHQCKECKDFPKLNDLGIDNFHCSKKCRKENIDCCKEEHTIKVLHFERTKYTYHGKEKKKVQLVDKELTPPQFLVHLKDKLQNFQVKHMTKQLMPYQMVQLSRSKIFQRTTLVSCPMKLCSYTGLKSKRLFSQSLFLEK